ncbi:MAG: hypothetical protein KBA90_13860 [Chitinophagaceae bacterium]|nr:hypothetical protein [Chitinophagaceae bacterium]MBP7109639.1 hypothetical protein [Chitinophagaceae bacterium]
MKILIMVLSYNEPPYDSLMRMQQATFDSIEVEGVRTVYYYGGGKGWVNEKEFSADADDLYFRMHWKFALALKEVWDWDWQFIFRTNSSSFICKDRLVEVAKNLPTENLYSGWRIDGPEYSICSGAGFWLSRDTAKLIIDNFDGEMNCEEDCLVGKLLWDNNVPIIDDKSRFDVPMSISEKEIPLDLYHYRFKTTQNRLADIGNMKMLHKLISFYDNHKPIGELIKL